jgi:hypothetical protein
LRSNRISANRFQEIDDSREPLKSTGTDKIGYSGCISFLGKVISVNNLAAAGPKATHVADDAGGLSEQDHAHDHSRIDNELIFN